MRFAWFAVLLAACGPDDSSGPCKDDLVAGDLVITEVFADYAAPDGGTGTDDGKEWFEIYNNADRPISLKGLKIVHSRPDGSKPAAHTMEDITLAPGQFFTLGNSTSDLVPPYVDYGYSADLGGLYNTDGGKLTLSCGDQEIDSATYEMVKSGHSRQLTNAGPPDYTQNDDPQAWCEAKDAEFEPNNFGTPGEESDCAPVVAGQCSEGGVMRDAVAPGVGDLVITEVMPKPKAVSATTGQWFEVLATRDVDLNGVGLDRASDSSAAKVIESTECIRLTAGQYGIFGRSADPTAFGGITPLATFDFSINPSTPPADVQIVYGSTILDAVTWPTSTSGASRALDPGKTDVVANDDSSNFCDGTTTYNTTANGTDLGTPGAANDACPSVAPPGMCDDGGTLRAIVPPAADTLVITEIMPAPAMNDNGAAEWFEITNVGSAAFDVNGLGLDRDGDSRPPDVVSASACKSVAPGGFALFARGTSNNGGLATVDATFGLAMVNTGGNVQVVDPVTCDAAAPYACTGVYDKVTWSSSTKGVSSQVKPGMYTTTANDLPANYCPGTTAYGTDGNLGTPRADNACM